MVPRSRSPTIPRIRAASRRRARSAARARSTSIIGTCPEMPRGRPRQKVCERGHSLEVSNLYCYNGQRRCRACALLIAKLPHNRKKNAARQRRYIATAAGKRALRLRRERYYLPSHAPTALVQTARLLKQLKKQSKRFCRRGHLLKDPNLYYSRGRRCCRACALLNSKLKYDREENTARMRRYRAKLARMKTLKGAS